MQPQSKVVGASLPVEGPDPKKPGETKTYMLRGLSHEDWSILSTWCANEPVKQITKLFRTVQLEPDEKAVLLKCAYQEGRGFTRDDLSPIMGTIEAMRVAIHCGLKRNHPELTLEEMNTVMTGDNFQEWLAAFTEVNSTGKEEEDGEGDGNPTGPATNSTTSQPPSNGPNSTGNS